MIFVYGYQETGRPVKATICLLVGLAYTLAFAALTVGHLNILSVSFTVTLIGVGIDYGVYYAARYLQLRDTRIVKDKTGIHRVPDPKILGGSNFADVGFELDPDAGRVVSLAAIDNLMKGAAGSAVQAMNLMCGFEETAGLEFPGLHPV